MLANNTNEVIQHLDTIIRESQNQNTPIGLFAALYRQVTFKLIAGIENSFFDNALLMKQYITQFANRYFAAFDAYKRGESNITKSWKISFASASREDLLIVQHLLLGANAHINLDLGIVAAQICPGDKLENLKDDFHRTNIIFGDLLNSVQQVISNFSPMFNILDTVGGRTDEILMNFSLRKAREEAWNTASILAYESFTQQQAIITLLDSKVALLGRILVEPPGIVLAKAVYTIKQAESKDISAIITALNNI
jgi:Family of unknown function (DUF5995)